MKQLKLLLLLCFIVILSSCSDDDNIVQPKLNLAKNGVYVLNEGGFGKNNATVTYYNFEKDSVYNEVFRSANGVVLGDGGNNMFIKDKKGFIVVSASNKVTVVNLDDFKILGEIDLQGINPREVVIASNNKGYVTSSDLGKVIKFDTEKYTVLDTIDCGPRPESIVESNNKLFVANSGWGTNNTVSVIDIKTDKLEKTLKVGFNPQELVVDNNGNVYAIATDSYFNPTGRSGVYKINSNSLTVTDSIAMTGNPTDACLYKDNMLLVINSSGANVVDLTSLKVTQLLIPKEKVVTVGSAWANIYSIAYDKKQNKIYCGNPKDFSQNGEIVIFDDNGNELKRFSCGVNPGTTIIVNN